MKRLFFASFVALSAVLGLRACGGNSTSDQIENKGTADNPKPGKSGPKGIPSFKDTVWDFKRVEDGEEVKHSYVFTNTGKGELTIRSAQASCGCTSPNWTKEPIPPGGTGFISPFGAGAVDRAPNLQASGETPSQSTTGGGTAGE